MECQTCSKIFPATSNLSEHVEFFQSRAQYLVRELLKCLAHANPREEESTGGINDDSNLDDDSDKDLAGDLAHDDLEDDDKQCPLPACERLAKFSTLKELQRHYATHISCHEVCLTCDRVFDRASTYLHHTCKKGQGNPGESVLRRRKALRQRVDKALNKSRKLKSREMQKLSTGDLDANLHHKRRKTGRNDISETRTDSANGLVNYTDNGAETVIPAEVLSSAASFPEIDDGMGLGSAEMFSHNLHGIPNFSKAPVFSAQNQYVFPYLEAEYGSRAPVIYSDMAFGSKMPAMFADTVFGSKSPVMYSDTVIDSNGESSVAAPDPSGWVAKESI